MPTKAQVESDIATKFANNTSGDISAQDAREVAQAVLDYAEENGGSGGGGGGGGVAAWEIVSTIVADNTVSLYDVDVTDFDDVIVSLQGVTMASAMDVYLEWFVGGSGGTKQTFQRTFYGGSNGSDAVTATSISAGLNTGAQWGSLRMSAVNAAMPAHGDTVTYTNQGAGNRFAMRFTQQGLGAIDTVRITNGAAINFSSGTIYVLGRRSNPVGSSVSINSQSGTAYTLALTDAGAVVTMDNAAANTVTIPADASVAFPVGARLHVVMKGAGVTSIAGNTGVTLNGVSAGSGALSGQFSEASLLKVGADEWIASGQIGAVA